MQSATTDQTGWMDAQADLRLRFVHMPFCGLVMKWLNYAFILVLKTLKGLDTVGRFFSFFTRETIFVTFFQKALP